ncbi:MAG TPA: DUF4296 domain-containing protein [Bacteroidales bacterium]|nr:DUF4296 domain-containing protein [Bacteroidales bacterium]
MKKRVLVLIWLSLVLTSACSFTNKKNESDKSKDEVISLLVDIQLLEAKLTYLRSKGSNVDSLSVVMYDSLFAVHKSSRQVLNQTITDLSKSPLELQEIYDSVSKRIEKMKNRSN